MVNLFFDFFASVDTSSVNEAFVDGPVGSNPIWTFRAASFIFIYLLIRAIIESYKERHNPPS